MHGASPAQAAPRTQRHAGRRVHGDARTDFDWIMPPRSLVDDPPAFGGSVDGRSFSHLDTRCPTAIQLQWRSTLGGDETQTFGRTRGDPMTERAEDSWIHATNARLQVICSAMDGRMVVRCGRIRPQRTSPLIGVMIRTASPDRPRPETANSRLTPTATTATSRLVNASVSDRARDFPKREVQSSQVTQPRRQPQSSFRYKLSSSEAVWHFGYSCSFSSTTRSYRRGISHS